ncbi:periodic tryptophan protein 1 homolog [Bacillus rossius redtenbacheri]|uniref:periodic tryptophan protein 1 homolog n=1 Tax=Bacillus rossius redtenbacheri TaxID=93214 RepID=UPI002FDD2F1E
MMEEGRVSFVPCVKWVKRGVTRQNPYVVELSEKQLGDILDTAKREVKAAEDEVAAGSGSDEYNMEKYDEEGCTEALFGVASAAVFASNARDPLVTGGDSDSEAEDDAIKPDDNLVAVGRVDDDASVLEVYVYNHDEGSLYVHHDLLLPSIPLCLEWLDRGNMLAVGGMDHIIAVWDLDVVNCLEPALKLGRKKRQQRMGHKDAVLDVSWNPVLPHLLASGSVDRTVLLWDLDTGIASSALPVFGEKVQALQWNPAESCTLLVGSCDHTLHLFECRSNRSKTWAASGEVERVVWDHFNPFYFLASTGNGNIEYFDVRADGPLWCVPAHEKEVAGLALSSKCPGLLVSAGSEGVAKVWDLKTSKPEFVTERKMKLGSIQCLDPNPDLPFIMCAGGDNKKNNFRVWDVLGVSREAKEVFSSRPLVTSGLEPMKTSDTMQAFEFLHLGQSTSTDVSPERTN